MDKKDISRGEGGSKPQDSKYLVLWGLPGGKTLPGLGGAEVGPLCADPAF